jgi:antitoxin HigA-1
MTMTMKNPPHPGLSVRHDCIEPLDLTITEAAEALGVTRQTLNNLVNGKSGISADMAIRLDKAFGGGAETWLRLQMAYDLAQARQHEADIDVSQCPGASCGNRIRDRAMGNRHEASSESG